jgi:hypothetical protein
VHLAAYFPLPDPAWPTTPWINAVFTVCAGMPIVLGLLYSARLFVRERNPIGFVCILGGAIAALVEPLVTYVGLVHYPTKGQWTVITGFGESIPLFLVFAYTAEIGVGSFAVWHLLRKGVGPRAVMKVWWVLLGADIVLETAALWLNVFYYYGPRPLNFFGLPLYWSALDAALAILPGVLLYLLWRKEWTVWHYLLVLALFPVNALAIYVGAGWPIFTLQHADVYIAWLWVVAFVTLLYTYILVRGFAALSVTDAVAIGRFRNAVMTLRAQRDPAE